MYRWLRRGAAAALAVLLLWGWAAAAEPSAHISPPGAPCDLTPLFSKASLSDEDYLLLLRQTGLGRAGVDGVLAQSGPEGLVQMQRQFFAPVSWNCARSTPLTRQETLTAPVALAPLQDSDVLVSAASHFFGWRNGHAALVVDAAEGRTLECAMFSAEFGQVSNWAWRANFVVLRLKNAGQAQRAAIARQAARRLLHTPYSISVGLFSPKGNGSQVPATQCAHLVWSAFAAFGYDVDATGGGIVTPCDIACSPAFEVVQIYGLAPDSRWIS